MATKKRTRHSSSTLLAEFLGGPGCDFLPSEVPTLRDVLRKGLLIREGKMLEDGGDRKNYPVRPMIEELVSSIHDQWQKSNVKFAPPVVTNYKTLVNRLLNVWEKVTAIAQKKETKQKIVTSWTSKLDKLFDITVCHCPITLCADSPSPPCKENCKAEAHIDCSCEKSVKIPVLELAWLKGQREKIGSRSKHLIGGADMVETEKQDKTSKRKLEEAESLAKQRKRSQEEEEEMFGRVLFTDSEELDMGEDLVAEGNVSEVEQDHDEVEDDGSREDDIAVDDLGTEKTRRNYLDLSNTAAASLRYGVSSTASAALCSSFLADLIKGKVLPPEYEYLAVDKSKVARAKERVMKESRAKDEERNQDEVISGIFADGRKDKTKVLVEDATTGRYHQRIVKEEHVSVTSEPDGRYLFHFTPEPATRSSKPARQEALALYEWMVEHGVDETVLVIGGDSTNPNTGRKGGMLTHLEKFLDRKCFWVVCMLHTTELPLRHLFTALDGKTNSKDGWTGPIGKKLEKINDLKRVLTFEPIPGIEELVEIPDDVVRNMSTDSSQCYRLLCALRDGCLSQTLANMRCGSLCHARWLTLGEAIMMLYMSEHGLDGEVYRKFILIVKYVSQVYFQIWFDIKVKHSIVDGPYHILTLLRLVRQQSEEVREIVIPYVRSGAWFAHPEAILVSLLSSPVPEERKFAVDQILTIRGDSDLGDISVRERVTPLLNIEATTLIEMIDWDREKIYEPVFTCKLTQSELTKVLESPLDIPYYPLHSQSTERAVKQVTEAAAAVCGPEKRDGYVRARVAHREIMPVFQSKKDLKQLFKKL